MRSSSRIADPPARERQADEALQRSSLAHDDLSCIHQHVVHAWAARHADTTPIAVTFALVGCYPHLARGCTGQRVQGVHHVLTAHDLAQ
ncbi:MAG: hypothetical protein MUF00_02060 [Gemmatimonadaceae bacterium]|jgi:hypothetical protein|nr:hypothetical protein [Gemmatimonadaceae bacterium]